MSSMEIDGLNSNIVFEVFGLGVRARFSLQSPTTRRGRIFASIADAMIAS